MKSSSIRTTEWRRRTKERMLASMGGKCVCCGYSKSRAALHFHHINPAEKDSSVSAMTSTITSWSKIVNELRKCVLVCSNCHAEIHHDERELPYDAYKFNEEFADYREESVYTERPVAEELRRWRECNLSEEIKGKRISDICIKFNVCDATVRKRLIKEKIPPPITNIKVEKEKDTVEVTHMSGYRTPNILAEANLLDEIKTNTAEALGRKYGVSGNSIRKRLKKLGWQAKRNKPRKEVSPKKVIIPLTKDDIEAALSLAGNVCKAAKLLNVTRGKLRFYMNKLSK